LGSPAGPEGLTESVRSAPGVSQTIALQLVAMLERVLLGIGVIIDILYPNWSISIFNASLNYAIAEEQPMILLFSFCPFPFSFFFFFSHPKPKNFIINCDHIFLNILKETCNKINTGLFILLLQAFTDQHLLS